MYMLKNVIVQYVYSITTVCQQIQCIHKFNKLSIVHNMYSRVNRKIAS